MELIRDLFFKCCTVDCLNRTGQANCLKTLLYRTERGPDPEVEIMKASIKATRSECVTDTRTCKIRFLKWKSLQ